MFVVEKLKLNKFVRVEIPKNDDYFARLGGSRPSIPAGAYSGDEIIPTGNKTDLLARACAINDKQLADEANDKEGAD